MNLDQYAKEAIRSESQIEKIDGVSAFGLHAALNAVVQSGNIVDQIKKHVFYGRAFDAEKLKGNVEFAIESLISIRDSLDDETFDKSGEVTDIAYRNDSKDAKTRVIEMTLGPFALAKINPRIFHTAVGAITESAELAEAMIKNLETGELDVVNFSEEIGDIMWYALGIFPDVSGIEGGRILHTNIAKLAKRYPEKFDAFLAQQENRDLKAEHEILAEGVSGEYERYFVNGVRKSIDDGCPECAPDDLATSFVIFGLPKNKTPFSIKSFETRSAADDACKKMNAENSSIATSYKQRADEVLLPRSNSNNLKQPAGKYMFETRPVYPLTWAELQDAAVRHGALIVRDTETKGVVKCIDPLSNDYCFVFYDEAGQYSDPYPSEESAALGLGAYIQYLEQGK